MVTANNRNILSVSRLNAEVRLCLEKNIGIVWLTGEISNFTAATSGHWYLSLKDNQSQVKCAMFRGNNRRVMFKPKNGDQVLVRARVSMYEPRGDYQLILESMQPEGDGRLQQAFEQRKQALAAEGLFAQSAKQALPDQPKRVGIITSKTGAALHDILNVLKRRDPSLPVVIYPTLVQGQEAAVSIAQAIGRANTRNECDVLIVGRGGGSLEDLWCFNEEIVARTIAASQIPIVSAVGHEVDVTIADFVADVRAPTPSAAAELVSRDLSYRLQQYQQREHALKNAIGTLLYRQQRALTHQEHRLSHQHPRRRLQQQSQHIDELQRRMHQALTKQVSRYSNQLTALDSRLQRMTPDRRIQQHQAQLAQYHQRLTHAMDSHLSHAQQRLATLVATLDAVSPLATLSRGYSISRDSDGHIVTNINQLREGDTLHTQLSNGDVTSVVQQHHSRQPTD
ncbi:exodeoxyribonuclease VII large subunit [Salinivibrio kushneri]|uniref:Exodeoxyribonuclease 7 large subunit n=1 Tax=Salinivibrio kushneri TaxID=1908198 RepID=A0AA47LT43_9GAMM|nr:exodeoxyribonuclease VII large subunit [Salinivibrio kushneri]WBA09962.1 exodeoxyribonuclease VII large subunit [Salinivibrio kushneri]